MSALRIRNPTTNQQPPERRAQVLGLFGAFICGEISESVLNDALERLQIRGNWQPQAKVRGYVGFDYPAQAWMELTIEADA